MKAMCIPDVRHFPYPTPPEEADVEDALKVRGCVQACSAVFVALVANSGRHSCCSVS